MTNAGVAFAVADEFKEDLGGLERETSLSSTPSLSLSVVTNTVLIASEWNSFLVLHNVNKELLCSLDMHVTKSMSNLTSMLLKQLRFRKRGLCLRCYQTLKWTPMSFPRALATAIKRLFQDKIV